MYCPQCGGANDDSARYCSTCGVDLEEYRDTWREGSTSSTEKSGPQAAHQQTQQGYRQDYHQPYSPPAYQNQYSQMGTGYGYGTVPKIPSYMGWAIATLILCFWPTGIVAVVYASQVGSKLAVGDFAGARESSRKAKMWSWISFGVALAGVAIVVLIMILAAAATFNTITVY